MERKLMSVESMKTVISNPKVEEMIKNAISDTFFTSVEFSFDDNSVLGYFSDAEPEEEKTNDNQYRIMMYWYNGVPLVEIYTLNDRIVFDFIAEC